MGIDKNIHILIVEDDDINRKLLANILNTIGFTNVLQAENGQLGWEFIQKEKIDLVMTDWMMPELDGLELLKRIRLSDTPLKTLPVIMITALGKQDDIMKAAEWDVNGYVVKPFSVNTVLSKIEEILG
ncbi:response regulator [bacterium]|nr:response regulator [bacterium]